MDDDEHNVTFLYKLTEGICEKSFGMNVATMAGIPLEIVKRATVVAEEVEVTHRLKDTTYAMAVDNQVNVTPAVIADMSYLFKNNDRSRTVTQRILQSFSKLIM